MINLKYKIFKKANRFNKYNKRVLKLKRPGYKFVLGPLRGRYKFKKKKLISEIKYQKNFKPKAEQFRKKRRLQKFFKVQPTSYLIRHSFNQSFKIIDSFPISVKSSAIRNNPHDKWKKNTKTKNKLELIYRTTFGKKLKRNFISSRYLLRWNLLQKNYFSSYYSISSILPKLNFFKTFSEIKHKLLFNKKGKILLNSDQKIKYSRAENLKIGDLIEVKGNLKTGYDVTPNKPRDLKYHIFRFGKESLNTEKIKRINDKEMEQLKMINKKGVKKKDLKKRELNQLKEKFNEKDLKKYFKKLNEKNKKFSSKQLKLLETIVNKKNTGIYTKKIKQNFISRSSAFSFIEYDNYAEQFIICKDLKNVSRSDAIFMNPSSKKLVSVNFLKK